jgi:hypothetical protein
VAQDKNGAQAILTTDAPASPTRAAFVLLLSNEATNGADMAVQKKLYTENRAILIYRRTVIAANSSTGDCGKSAY